MEFVKLRILIADFGCCFAGVVTRLWSFVVVVDGRWSLAGADDEARAAFPLNDRRAHKAAKLLFDALGVAA